MACTIVQYILIMSILFVWVIVVSIGGGIIRKAPLPCGCDYKKELIEVREKKKKKLQKTKEKKMKRHVLGSSA